MRQSVYVNTTEKGYTRYAYPSNGLQSKVYSTIIDTNNNNTGDAADEVMSESWSDGAGRTRMSRVPHTFNTDGSTATWAGTQTEYDILGRVKRSSVPTEINSSWNPTGDDYRGMSGSEYIWLWNTQEYDWKGRVVKSIPTDSNGNDGKETLISYEGCGCAGGQVTTVQGELVPRDDQPGVTARRTQKSYADIFGRDYKTEMLDWSGSVYKTVTNNYNGSDQTVSAREIAGTETSSDFRETTSTYDGFGRVKTFHSPEQDANKFINYTYTVDNKPLTITDARGAVKNFQYNNLGLLQQVSYETPGDLPIVYTQPIMTHSSGNVDGSIYKLRFKGTNVDANAEIEVSNLPNNQHLRYSNLERSTENGEQVLVFDIANESYLYNYINSSSQGLSLFFAIVNPDTGKKSLAALANYTFYYGNRIVSVFAPQIPPTTYAVTETPTVSYAYNNLGMRTAMTDGSGTVNYEYNGLGQLTAETRSFSETPPITPVPNSNSFRIDYTYGLSGQLTSYKEPFGEIVSYTQDETGRLKTVSGNRTVENVQLTYVTDAKYRAWGAAKEVNFIGGRSETSNFNAGLQVNDYVFSVPGYSTHLQYTYFDDGKLKNSSYLSNLNLNSQNLPKFDRSYEYDFGGRLKDAKTGAEARGQTETNPLNRPYRMTLDYNQFDDITSQNRLHYGSTFNAAFEYDAARNTHENGTGIIPGWVNTGSNIDNVFDADGRSLGDLRSAPINTFDVEGRRSTVRDTDTDTAIGPISVNYDGDGRKIRTAKPFNYYCNGTSGTLCLGSRPHYYISSTVLGQEIGDFGQGDGGGMERNSKIFGNGNRIAERRVRLGGAQEATFLQRADPSGVEVIDQVVQASSSWNYSLWGDGSGTVDPFGAGVGYENPYPPASGPPDPHDPESGCVWGNDGEPDFECPMPEDYDDQSDEETETGSIEEDTCYNKDGLKIKCKEHGDVVTFEDKKTGKLYLGIYDANNEGYNVNGTFVPERPNRHGIGLKPRLIKKDESRTISNEPLEEPIGGWNDESGPKPAPTPQTLRSSLPNYARSVYQGDLGKKLTDCINKVFSKEITGRNGVTATGANLLEPQTTRNAPAVDDKTFTSFVLGGGTGPLAAGSSFDGDEKRFGRNGTIYIANDIAAINSPISGKVLLSQFEIYQRTYVHELGNLLSRRISPKGEADTFGSSPGISGNLGTKPDTDTGAQLENCVYGNVSP